MLQLSCIYLYNSSSNFSGTCGGNFTAKNGHMSSPSYPNIYPTKSNCTYTISQATGTVIILNFLTMDIPFTRYCYYNYIEIRDGPSETSPSLVDNDREAPSDKKNFSRVDFRAKYLGFMKRNRKPSKEQAMAP